MLSASDLRGMQDATLYLHLLINGRPIGADIPVRQRGANFLVRTADLRSAGVANDSLAAINGNEWFDVTAHPDIQVDYDSNALRMNVILPVDWLPEQRFSVARRRTDAPAHSDVGGIISYDFYAAEGPDNSRTASVWSEQRLFSPVGVLRNTGAYLHSSRVRALEINRATQQGYIRYDTQWSSADENSLQNWVVGDTITGALAWSAPVRLGGVQIARDFRVRPDLITYPLPTFSGQAAVPTTLDLFINGQRASSEQVQPGPFTLSDIPFISGAGEATIVTNDALGRPIATTLPFYANAQLLRAGLSDYSLSIGLLRKNFGRDNFDYGPPAAAGTFRHGLNDVLTLEAQAEISDDPDTPITLGGAGALVRLGMLGMLNAAASYSEASTAGLGGWQYALGYQYSRRGFHIGYQGMRTQAGYRSLANHQFAAGELDRRRSDVFTVGFASSRFGSTNLGLLDARTDRESRVRLATLSYSRNLLANMNLYLNASHDLERRRNAFMLYVMTSFGRNTHLSVGARHERSTSAHLDFSRSPPPEGGLGWQFSHSLNERHTGQTNAALSWNNQVVHMGAGIYGSDELRTRWANVRGSLVTLDSALFASRQVGDAFVLIDTEGVADVPVHYENQLVGYTDDRGHLLVPWVTSHYEARYAIDALDLPHNMRVPYTERRISVRRGSGARLDFPLQQINAFAMIIVDAQGAHLPLGSVAQDRASGHRAIIGHDGMVYFEDIEHAGELNVTLQDAGACRVSYATHDADAPVIGPFTCE